MSSTIIIIIIAILSILNVVAAIVFDGRLKKGKAKTTICKEIKDLSVFGWTLIISVIILGVFTGIGAVKDQIESDKQLTENTKRYEKDTIRLNNWIRELKAKGKSDSLEIARLTSEVKNNGLKSDSIKIQLIDNSIAENERERKIKDHYKQNVFNAYKSEIIMNLDRLIAQYTKTNIDNLKKDSTISFNARSNYKYLQDYKGITSSYELISLIDYTIESIRLSNQCADKLQTPLIKKSRDYNIELLLLYIERTGIALTILKSTSKDINYYKEYETSNLDKKIKLVESGFLKDYERIDKNIKEINNSFIVKE